MSCRLNVTIMVRGGALSHDISFLYTRAYEIAQGNTNIDINIRRKQSPQLCNFKTFRYYITVCCKGKKLCFTLNTKEHKKKTYISFSAWF